MLAIGGGMLMPRDAIPLHVQYATELSGRARPRLCVLNQAVGDDPNTYLRFYDRLAGAPVEVRHLSLFPMPNVSDPEDLLMSQDIIFVGGGSVANMLAVWRVHGIDEIMRKAWAAGIVLAGSSAGGICWFTGGTTDSFGPRLRPFTDGLGMLAGSFCPHYHSEAERRPLYQRLVAEGALPGGLACDDGVGAHFVDDDLAEMVADRPGGAGYRVEPAGDGGATETELPVRFLGVSREPALRWATREQAVAKRAAASGKTRPSPPVMRGWRGRRSHGPFDKLGLSGLLIFGFLLSGGGGPVQGPGERGDDEDRQQPPGVDLGRVGDERGQREAGHDQGGDVPVAPTMKSYQNAPNDLSCFMSRRPPIAARTR